MAVDPEVADRVLRRMIIVAIVAIEDSAIDKVLMKIEAGDKVKTETSVADRVSKKVVPTSTASNTGLNLPKIPFTLLSVKAPPDVSSTGLNSPNIPLI